MCLQTDGKVLVGGAFIGVDGAPSRSHLARLLPDGTSDSTFLGPTTPISNTIWSLAEQADGRIVIGGDFAFIGQISRSHVARLNSNGTVDGSFIPTNAIDNSVLALAIQTNNAVIIGGTFSQGTFPSWVARLNADGSTDTSFGAYLNGAVYAIMIQSDGKILIGGTFTTANGATRNHIARLNADGSLDNTFQNGLTGASAAVRCIQIQNDGKILIGGDFNTVNGSYHSYVARLNTDGSTDAGFSPVSGMIGPVYSAAVQANNSIVLGGSAQYPNLVLRVYPDGTRDTTFTNSSLNGTVQALAIQNDGRLLIGGSIFSTNSGKLSDLERIYGDLYPPEFVVQPAGRGTNVGASVTFSADVRNPTPVNFQWSKDGIDIPGATGSSYSIFNVQFPDAGNYSVFVTDPVGSTTSSNALLQVGIAPAFTSQADGLVVTQGQSASFAVTATGTPLNYFWKKNGIFLSGQTNSSLTLNSVVTTDAGLYVCQVSNFISSVTSTGAVLNVISLPPTNSILSANLGAGPNMNLSLVGTPGSSYILEATTNLLPPIQWVPILTNAADSNGVWQFTDTNLSNAQLYYRVTTP
jgi:uncharacterized delta-60 repeat protein